MCNTWRRAQQNGEGHQGKWEETGVVLGRSDASDMGDASMGRGRRVEQVEQRRDDQRLHGEAWVQDSSVACIERGGVRVLSHRRGDD